MAEEAVEGVDATFGHPNGASITNKDTILQEVDAALGVNQPPRIEYLLAEPWSDVDLGWLGRGLSLNTYGHSVIRYVHNDVDVVMNIVSKEGVPVVNLIPTNEFLFGTEHMDGAAQQTVYTRNFVGVRIEDWPEDLVGDMDYYFRRLQRMEKRGLMKFNLVLGPFMNWLRSYVPFVERGNCSYWTSKGLVEAVVLPFSLVFPKATFVEVMERMYAMDPKNVHVVYYERVPHAHHTYGSDLPPLPSLVRPGFMSPVSNWTYKNLKAYADVVVRVPDNSMKAVVQRQDEPLRPSWFRYVASLATVGALLTASIGVSMWWGRRRWMTRRTLAVAKRTRTHDPASRVSTAGAVSDVVRSNGGSSARNKGNPRTVHRVRREDMLALMRQAAKHLRRIARVDSDGRGGGKGGGRDEPPTPK